MGPDAVEKMEPGYYIQTESTSYVNEINIIAMEKRTARLTLLIDPRKKAVFERLCAREDVTPSQKVRQFIREYVQRELGDDWMTQAELVLREKEEKEGPET
ncbi:hypothetical protein ACLD02_18785 [Alloalcanivorax sp. C16-2]